MIPHESEVLTLLMSQTFLFHLINILQGLTSAIPRALKILLYAMLNLELHNGQGDDFFICNY